MEAVFNYIIGLGAAVMMPIIFTILGVYRNQIWKKLSRVAYSSVWVS